ncbi:MAG: hypothetical protein ACUZ8N_16830 [Candidatus Scalindua sp.]
MDADFPRLSASLLGGDKRRPCPSGRRGGQEGAKNAPRTKDAEDKEKK